jgi:hypothetical protein
MGILLQSLDFDSKRVSLEIAGRLSPRDRLRLTETVHFTRTIGFSRISVHHPDILPVETAQCLERLAKEVGIERVPAGSLHAVPETSPSSLHVHRRVDAASPDQESERTDYSIRFYELQDVVDRITRLVLVLGKVVPLEDDTITRLRLCLYELCVNTMESAPLLTGDTLIELKIAVAGLWIDVTYRDNVAFIHAGNREIHGEWRERTERRRDPRLDVLQKLMAEPRYRRAGHWRTTAFRIDRNRVPPTEREAEGMEG